MDTSEEEHKDDIEVEEVFESEEEEAKGNKDEGPELKY